MVKKKPKDLSQLREGFTTGACSAAAAKVANEGADVVCQILKQIAPLMPIGKQPHAGT